MNTLRQSEFSSHAVCGAVQNYTIGIRVGNWSSGQKTFSDLFTWTWFRNPWSGIAATLRENHAEVGSAIDQSSHRGPLITRNRFPNTGELPNQKGYDTVDCQRTFGVVFPILKGRQLHINHSDSEWSFSTNRISVTPITTAQMTQIKIKRDLITKT